MIRINRLLRTAKIIQNKSVRGGPGWDRPDVPPTQRVQRTTRFTQDQIIYTFFDPSMPQFFLTEPQVYEGGLMGGLKQLSSIWAFFIGTAFAIFGFHQLVNHKRTHVVLEPFQANYFMNQIKRINEDKVAFKDAKQNPFGININVEQFPNDNYGKYYYPNRYFVIKSSQEHLQTIHKQAAEYLKNAIQRAKNAHGHEHH